MAARRRPRPRVGPDACGPCSRSSSGRTRRATRCRTSSTSGCGSASPSPRCSSAPCGASSTRSGCCTPGCSVSPASHPTSRCCPTAGGCGPRRSGLGTFTWVELVAEENTSLGFLRLLIAGFFAVSLLGAAVFGRTWFDHADPFEAWSRLLGLLSPLGRRDDGRWVLRTPLHGVNAPARPAWARAHRGRHARRHGIRRLLGEPLVGDVRADLARPVVAAQDGDPARLLRARGRDALAGVGGVGAARAASRSAVASPSSATSPRRSSRSPAATSSRTTGRCGSTRGSTRGGCSPTRSAPAPTCSAPPTSPRATCSSSRHSSRRSRP